ncbi:hypothetical protein BJP36_36775 [Moorena producens JHB]|uniref:Uncharacterized protein n=1 Tax=Moorena producens (strain JHB) TaxID=1454205 RepID=A0A9Q9SU30_MOOP1|nr:hypothetical protein [Moorena producens]WAN69647.1 hypothetical protein BJP36_36775 [Moorena producens JHB]
MPFWPRDRVQPTLRERQRRTTFNQITLTFWPRDRVQPSTLQPNNLGLLATRSRSTLQPNNLGLLATRSRSTFNPSTND